MAQPGAGQRQGKTLACLALDAGLSRSGPRRHGSRNSPHRSRHQLPRQPLEVPHLKAPQSSGGDHGQHPTAQFFTLLELIQPGLMSSLPGVSRGAKRTRLAGSLLEWIELVAQFWGSHRDAPAEPDGSPSGCPMQPLAVVRTADQLTAGIPAPLLETGWCVRAELLRLTSGGELVGSQGPAEGTTRLEAGEGIAISDLAPPGAIRAWTIPQIAPSQLRS